MRYKNGQHEQKSHRNNNKRASLSLPRGKLFATHLFISFVFFFWFFVIFLEGEKTKLETCTRKMKSKARQSKKRQNYDERDML